MVTHLLITTSNLPVQRGLANPTTAIARLLIFSRAEKCSQNAPQSIRFPAQFTTSTDSENLCFFHSRFGAKTLKCQVPCSWQPRNSCNFPNKNCNRAVPYSGRSRRKAKSSLSSLSLFYYPYTRMNFNIDTASAISMIPPRRRYRTYSGPQNSIDTNSTPIHIFGTKKLNINVGVRYTLAWIFKVANVSIPIIGTNFLRHFGLGVDAVNNAFILSHDSVCRRHNTSHSAVNYVNRISCASASHAIKSPLSSTSSTDVINKFPLEACAAHNAVHNLDAANAIAHSIHELVRNFADLPNIHDAAASSFQQRPKDPLQGAISNHAGLHAPPSLMGLMQMFLNITHLQKIEAFLLTVSLLNLR